MATAGLREAGVPHRFFDPVAHVVGIQTQAVAGQEQRGFHRADFEQRATGFQVAFDPEEGLRTERNESVFAAFASAHEHDFPRLIDVGDVEVDEFSAAQASAVKGFQDRAVAHAERIGYVGHGKDCGHFVGRQSAGQGAGLLAREFEIGSGIGREMVFAAEPGKEVLHDAEPGALRAHGEGFAIGLAMQPEVALVGFQGGFIDLRGSQEPTGFGPA